MRKTTKRGSLDISINSIVVIVLAFTFLALGLTFIKGLFSKIIEVPDEPLEQIKSQIRQQLTQSGERLVIQSSDISVGKNSEKLIAFGVANKGDGELNYLVEIYEVGEPSPTASTNDYGGANLPSNAGFQWDYTDQTLSVLGDDATKVENMKFFAPPTSGSFHYKVVVVDIDTGNEYSSKSFFIKVA
ncbi:hypothetical protein ACFLZX_01930 [Nanoarchaeota archaeon]